MRKYLLFLLSVFLALPLAAQVQITGSAVQVGGTTSGVASITAGTNVTISEGSPCSTGNCTINSTGGGGGGVTVNGGIFTISYSGLYDDNDAHSRSIPLASYSCSGSGSSGTCTVHSVSAHNLVAGDFVDMSLTTNWPPEEQTYGYGSFKVISTGLTSTQFEFNYDPSKFSSQVPPQTPPSSCSSSCGNAALATYWAFYQMVNQPIFSTLSGYAGVGGKITDTDTNFTNWVTPYCHLGDPNPTYILIEAGQNDMNAGVSTATMEAAYLSVYAKIHACNANAKVIQGSLTPGSFGGGASPSLGKQYLDLNTWFLQQRKTSSNAASGQYIDGYVAYNESMSDTTVCTLPDPNCGTTFATLTALSAVNGFQLPTGPPPILAQYPAGGGFSVDNSMPFTYFLGSGNIWKTETGGTVIYNNWSGFGSPTLGFYNASASPDTKFAHFCVNLACRNEFNFDMHLDASSANDNWSVFWTGDSDATVRYYPGQKVLYPWLAGGGTRTIGVDNNGVLQAVAGGSGLSGMTAGQVPIAASATTVTSSKALAGSGVGITTGPTSSTNLDCAQFSGTTGQLADSGAPCSGGSAFITSLTTTGSSGAATVTSGVLNIPVYSGGGGGNALPFTLIQESTFFYTATGSSTYTFPSALQASGATAYIMLAAGGSVSGTCPTGWTQDINITGGSFDRLMVCHKASAGDTTADLSGIQFLAGYFVELSGSRTIDQSSTGNNSGTASFIILPSITPTANSMTFGIAAIISSNTPAAGINYLDPVLNPLWTNIFVNNTAQHYFIGHIYGQTSAASVAIKPPVLNFSSFSPLSSGGYAWATFNIK